jgi:hypothetical protein
MIRVSNFSKSHWRTAAIPLFVAAIGLFSSSALAHAGSIVTDGGFESAGGGNVYFAGQSIDGGSWTVGSGAIYIDNLDPWVYDGANSVNLTYASPYVANSLTQALTTVVGQDYAVSFWANADTPNTFSLTEDGAGVNGIPAAIVQNGFPDQVDALGNSALFVDYTGWFTATSTTTDLTFTSTGNPPIGSLDGSVMIDDVSVTATPEPDSIVLMLTGFLGLGLAIGTRRLGRHVSAGAQPIQG